MKPLSATPQPASARRSRRPHPALRPAEQLRLLGRWAGGSIGQAEALAGINVQSHVERTALWAQFRHLFGGETQTLIDAVMDHCARITLQRLARGELCLLPAR
jgi:hypothetical protein